MYNNIYGNDSYLAHYGVLGMKWGVRRYQNADGSLTAKGKKKYSSVYSKMKTTKAADKKANKEYSKAYNSAYNYSARHFITQFKKGRRAYDESNRRWDEAILLAKESNKAHNEYKHAKTDYKKQYNENKLLVESKATKGDRLLYNSATRAKAAKIMTKYDNVSYDEAIKKAKGEALRNTAVILAAYGAYNIYNNK